MGDHWFVIKGSGSREAGAEGRAGLPRRALKHFAAHQAALLGTAGAGASAGEWVDSPELGAGGRLQALLGAGPGTLVTAGDIAPGWEMEEDLLRVDL